MKKTIIAIIGGAVVVALCLFLVNHDSSRMAAVSFLRYEVGSDGIVRAWFAATNPSRSFVVCKAQAEPNVSTADWSAAVVSIPARGTSTFGLPVRQTGTSWQLTLNCWRLQVKPHSLDASQLSDRPDFTTTSPVISSGSPVQHNDA